MLVDRGQVWTMRLLPFTAAARPGRLVRRPPARSLSGSASKSACRPGLVQVLSLTFGPRYVPYAI